MEKQINLNEQEAQTVINVLNEKNQTLEPAVNNIKGVITKIVEAFKPDEKEQEKKSNK